MSQVDALFFVLHPLGFHIPRTSLVPCPSGHLDGKPLMAASMHFGRNVGDRLLVWKVTYWVRCPFYPPRQQRSDRDQCQNPYAIVFLAIPTWDAQESQIVEMLQSTPFRKGWWLMSRHLKASLQAGRCTSIKRGSRFDIPNAESRHVCMVTGTYFD